MSLATGDSPNPLGCCQMQLVADCESRPGETCRTVIDGIAALGERATPELQEVSRMAAWRLDHMSWQQETHQELAAHFQPLDFPQEDDSSRSASAAPHAD